MYSIRNGMEADRVILNGLLAANDMEVDRLPSEFLILEIDGELVGAIRLEWEEGLAYIHPIVVGEKWRGKDVGKALIHAAADGLSELFAVARGEAVGFYRKLGFRPLLWEKVPERYRLECENCPTLDDCQPAPMVWKRSVQETL